LGAAPEIVGELQVSITDRRLSVLPQQTTMSPNGRQLFGVPGG
jgi:hypothetical protein